MNKFNDIKSFKNYFFNSLADLLQKDGYKSYCSKNLFLKTDNDHRFNIFIYLYKRETFIEIETKIYYGNKNVEKKLKNTGVTANIDTICGGDVDFVSTYYFKDTSGQKYSNIIYDLNTSADLIIKQWTCFYLKIIKTFFDDCTNPAILNNIVNDQSIDIPGLNTTYETRVLKFYFVGELANVDPMILEEKFHCYEKELRTFNPKYLDKFLTVKNVLFTK